MNFYSVIIGTELLNGRRADAHFPFVNGELLKRGWIHKGSFVIKDEPSFIESVFTLIKNDPHSVMFCFGGIGATPDDYTRLCAANVFTDSKMEINQGAKRSIEERFGAEAYPHRINMAHLPIGSGLLENIVSNVPGFYLEDRFFFMPGFPSMSHHMVLEALDNFYPNNLQQTFRSTMSIFVSENDLVDTMKTLSDQVDLSSLPIIDGEKRYTVIAISSYDEAIMKQEFSKFIDFCESNGITYQMGDMKDNSNRGV